MMLLAKGLAVSANPFTNITNKTNNPKPKTIMKKTIYQMKKQLSLIFDAKIQ